MSHATEAGVEIRKTPTERSQEFLPGILFLSGSAGLIYEVVWTHQFANIIGNTTESMAVVFSVFLAGLAAGGFAFGRGKALLRSPLLTYALMEIGIGLFGISASLLLLRYENEIAILIPKPKGTVTQIAAQVGLVSCFVAPATLLMGGTLPVIMEAARRWFLPSRQVAALYGINTAGGAMGALLPGLILVPEVGLSGTALVGMSINITVGAMALAFRKWARDQDASAPAGGPRHAAELETSDDEEATRIGPWGLAMLSAVSGFVVLSMEMCWGRLSRLILGNRTLATSVLLFGVLVFLGLGSRTSRGLGRALRRRLGWGSDEVLAAAFLVSAIAQVSCSAVGVQIALAETWPEAASLLALLALMGPPFYSAGLVFPWLLAHHPAVDHRTARSVGSLYAWNVAGCTLGALATSFVAFETLGTPATLTADGAAFLAIGLLLAAAHGTKLRVLAASSALACGLLALTSVPRDAFPVPRGETIVAAEEDRYGVQVLSRDQHGLLTATNNKVRLVARLGEPNTLYAQHLQADVPMLLAEETTSVLNIGTGFGITAGAFTLWKKSFASLVTIEILPFMVRHQPEFASGNYGFFRNEPPRVSLVQGDGRHWLVASAEKYDIISVNPLNPMLPGSSTLCTVDFWRVARSRLHRGGIYAQLIWGPETKVLLQGFATVFPEFLMFRAYGSSYVVVGTAEGGSLPPFHFERVGDEVREVYRRFGIEQLEEFYDVLREVAERDTAMWKEELRRNPEPSLHSNDRPILEYSRRHGASAFRIPDEVW